MNADNPLGAFRFLVTLDAADAYLPPALAALVPQVAAGGFTECSGLGGELELLTYPEGGQNDFVHQLPVGYRWGKLSLRRGLVRDGALWDWFRAGQHGALGARRDGVIFVLDEQGRPSLAFNFRAGLVSRWGGPSLHSTNSAVALEELEVAHQGLERIAL